MPQNTLTDSQTLSVEAMKATLVEAQFCKSLQEFGALLQQQGKPPSCFISYAWGCEQKLIDRVHQIAKYLWYAGLKVSLDIEHNYLGTSVGEFVRLIDTVDYVVWMGTKKLVEKSSAVNLQRAHDVEFGQQLLREQEELPVVSRETVRIAQRLEREGKGFLKPLCLEANHLQAFPHFVRDLVSEPFMAWPHYAGLFKLLNVLLPGWQDKLNALAQAFADYQQRIAKTPPDTVLELVNARQAVDAHEQRQFEQALKWHAQQLLTQLRQRSTRMLHLVQNCGLGPQEALLVEKAQLALYSHYQQNAHIRLFDDNVPVRLQELYVNLVIIEEIEQLEKEKKLQDGSAKANARLARLQIYEDILQAKEPLDIKALFKPQKSRRFPAQGIEPQRLLLLGGAGIGKTTFCQYLAHQWQQQALLEGFTWVFHVELKRLVQQFPADTALTAHLLADVLSRCFWQANHTISEDERKQLWQLLQRNPDQQKILWLLDGYDEVAHLNHPVVDLLLRQPRYLLTSRPYAVQQPQRQAVDVVLENIGFTPDNIKAYIEKFFLQHKADANQGMELHQWLQKSVAIRSMSAIPIYLELLCQVWLTEQAQLIGRSELSLAGLYQTLTEKLMRRFLVRLGKRVDAMSQEELKEQLGVRLAYRFLGQFAFEGLQSGRLLIAGSTFETCYDHVRKSFSRETVADLKELRAESFIDLLQGAGFLKNVGDHAYFARNDYYFLHLSFQEFFAAWHISEQLHTAKIAAFIAQHKYDPAWSLVWTLVAGLNAQDSEKLNNFFKQLLAPPRDLVGQYETILLAQCLEACRAPTMLSYRAEFITALQAWIKVSLERRQAAPILNALLQLPYMCQLTELESICMQVVTDMNDWYNKGFACRLLGALDSSRGLSQQGIQALLTGCQDTNQWVREEALKALGRLFAPDAAVVQALLKGCQDAEGRVRQTALRGLGRLPAPDAAVVQALLAGCQDAEEWVPGVGFEALGRALDRLPAPDASGIQALLRGCQDANAKVRQTALEALGHLPAPDATVVQALLTGCQDDDWSVRQTAIRAITLKNLCEFYPSQLIGQANVREALKTKLAEQTAAIFKQDKTYCFYISQQRQEATSANPNQLKRDLAALRWVPMVCPPQKEKLIPLTDLFKPKRNSQNLSTGVAEQLSSDTNNHNNSAATIKRLNNL